jgi:outer membrane protein assembly factor BamB
MKTTFVSYSSIVIIGCFAAVCGWSTEVSTREAARWPQFRGPQSLGIADGATVPDRWSTTENVDWVVDVPGRGWSSPIVWDDKVFITTAVGGGAWKEPSTGIYGNDYIAELRKQGLSNAEVSRRVRARDNEVPDELKEDIEWRLSCYHAKTGRKLWDAALHKGKPFGGRHRKNTYASETPVVDGERVYVYLGNIGLFAYSLDGKKLWATPLDPHRIYLDFGTGSSPVVHDQRVLVLDDNQETSSIAAYDSKTGTRLWQTPREFKPPMVKSSFSTPFIWKSGTRTEIITLGPTALASYDLDGRELWRLRGTSQVGAPTPVAGGQLLIVGSGSPSENVRPLLAVKAGASGDITPPDGASTNEHVVWYQERGGPYITSPLAYDGRVYVLFDQGFFGASDLLTGRTLYKVRVGETPATFSASPIGINNRIYCLSEDGDMYVIQAGDDYKLIAKNSLDEMSLATPAVVSDALFIRTATKLYRIGAKGKTS